MPRIPDASAFPARAPLQGRGAVPAADGAASGMMTAATLFGRAAHEQAAGVQEFGQELGRASQIMLEAEIKGQARRDAVGRAKAVSILNLEGAEEHRRLSVESDWSDPKTLRGYHEFLNKKSREVMEQYGGSADSQAQLTERIEGLRAGLADAASAAHFKAGQKLVTDTLGNSLNELHAKVYASPSDLMNVMATYDAQLADLSATLSPDEERAHRQIGAETLATGALQSMLDRQQIDAVENILLETPGIRNMIGPTNQRQIFDRISTIRQKLAEAAKPIVVGNALVTQDGKIIYRDPGDPVVVGNSLVTRGGKVLYKGEAEGDKPFGAGVTGRSLQMFAENAPLFASGQLTPQQDRLFLAAVQDYMQPTQYQNPDTGLLETRRNAVPGYVAEALAARGYRLPDGSVSSLVAKPASEEKPTPSAKEAPPPTIPPEAQIPDPSGALSEGLPTMGEMVLSGNVTGPGPTFGRFLSRVPGLGITAPEQMQADQYFSIMNTRLVRALQTNPRFAASERQDIIERVVKTDPGLLDTEQAMINRMIGIDKALGNWEVELQAAAQDDRALVSGETAQHAMDSLQAIRHFRRILLPRYAETTEDAIKFAKTAPIGSTILVQDANGNWVKKVLKKRPGEGEKK